VTLAAQTKDEPTRRHAPTWLWAVVVLVGLGLLASALVVLRATRGVEVANVTWPCWPPLNAFPREDAESAFPVAVDDLCRTETSRQLATGLVLGLIGAVVTGLSVVLFGRRTRA
jgi:hypothetical protein